MTIHEFGFYDTRKMHSRKKDHLTHIHRISLTVLNKPDCIHIALPLLSVAKFIYSLKTPRTTSKCATTSISTRRPIWKPTSSFKMTICATPLLTPTSESDMVKWRY